MNSRRAHLGGLLREIPLGRYPPRSCLAVLPIIGCLLSWSHRNVRGCGGIAGGRLDVVHAVSGAAGSALSISVLYPLEIARTRLQVGVASPSGSAGACSSSLRLVRDIGAAEGLRGLYRGWSSLVVALMALNFVYFYSFRASKRWTSGLVGGFGSAVDSTRDDGDEEGVGFVNATAVDLMAGYLAGVVAVLVTGPLWLGECVGYYLLHDDVESFYDFVAN
jgi:hypothetical protein